MQPVTVVSEMANGAKAKAKSLMVSTSRVSTGIRR